MAWLIAPQVRRYGLEIGEQQDSPQGHEVSFYCPYCQEQIEANKTLTEEAMRYIERHMMREIVIPMMHKAFSGFEDGNRNTGGFISVRIEYKRESLPPRPIHGPEPADMIEVEFLCCGKNAKVSEGWTSIDKCVFCGTEVKVT
jgi:hypothetical protein